MQTVGVRELKNRLTQLSWKKPALSGLVFAFSSPPVFKEGLGVVAFDFNQFMDKKTKVKS